MHRLKRHSLKCPLAGLLIVSLSACGSGDSDNSATDTVDDEVTAITEPSAGPLDTPDEPTEQTLADDDSEALMENPEETQVPVGTSSDTSSIAGLWDVTQMTSAGDDVAVVQIGSAGELNEFDFQADSSGDGRDCYVVTEQQIASRGADQYDIQNDSILPGSAGSEDVFIVVEDEEIVFRFFALIPAPEGGNELSPLTARFPAANIAPEELVACE